MLDIFDTRSIYPERFDEVDGYERFCPAIDKNVFLSYNVKDGVKMCSNYANCDKKKKENCKLIKRKTVGTASGDE